MARRIGVLTELQQNDELFPPIVAEIKRATPQTLKRFKLVSDVTIYKYIKGEACAPGVEESILESLEKYKAGRKTVETANVDRAKAILK